MAAVVDLLNRWGAAFTALAGLALWQATIVAILVGLVAVVLRRSSPAARYWLWQLVAIKLLLLPLGSWSVGLAWLPARQSEPAVPTIPIAAVEAPAEDAIAAEAEVALPSPALPVVATPVIESNPADAVAVAAEILPQAQMQRQVVETSAAKLGWQAWLLLGWALVVAIQLVRLFVQRRRLAGMLRETTPGDAALLAVVNQIAQQLRMPRTPEVAITELDCSPFACGIWRPRVVVPASLLVELDAVQLKQVLAHELAHLKRRDLVWGWLTESARLLYFFHPAMLFAARRVRLERELACDQIAMRLSGRGPAEYAETLVRVLSSAAVSSAFRTAAASLDGGERSLRSEESER
jgi:beta-lactamase regulating signal transducer with metallopeptidase domain